MCIATNLTANAVNTFTSYGYGPVLSVMWSYACGFNAEIYINGVVYHDPTLPSHTLWPPATGGVVCEAPQVDVVAGATFDVFIRAHYSDGTYADSSAISYTVPAGFNTAPPPTQPAPTNPKKKGNGK